MIKLIGLNIKQIIDENIKSIIIFLALFAVKMTKKMQRYKQKLKKSRVVVCLI